MPPSDFEKVGEATPRPGIDQLTFCIADEQDGAVTFNVASLRPDQENPEDLLGEAVVSYDGVSLGEQLTVRLQHGKIRETAKYVVEHKGIVLAAGAVVLGSLYIRHKRQ